ncbi:Mannosyl oligosaccharide glucosidase [Anatilimnocola aggregata]|uniref:Mannosyl oligosaccharide glucosidase n=1 Tax=Anatilimnocola aggregata TaxID=2528021 RepID=A0A517YDK7_9BACT|nr:glucosidase [Anatilimnocola aggregata]QDU28222.1 Mannosyl oligosaccharide glucosidase [Anatilimnocola aggregata]
MTPEQQRLAEHDAKSTNWKRWGPYLSERAWGTVREDYSASGDSWAYFSHDDARSRAYRWNEDGIGGFCDDKQYLCLAVALWNERDPILKERMFGLSNPQGNHGEDVKEYYFFLDGTPTHSYMKMVYKYPQVAYPYEDLVKVNGARGRDQPEYELFDALHDTFLANRYFDVSIEYAKASPEDLLCRITVVNRGPAAAPIHVLPHLWYRNTWSWKFNSTRPSIKAVGPGTASTSHEVLGNRWWYVRTSDNQQVELLFTENDSNIERLDHYPNTSPFVKDGIHEAVVHNAKSAVNNLQGSKLAGHARAVIPAGGTIVVDVRLSDTHSSEPFGDFDHFLTTRAAEADSFYAAVQPAGLDVDEQRIMRQALAGLLWSKQFYHYDVYRWLRGDETEPTPPDARWHGRNTNWKELHNADVILMPDTWEYPWYASWDLSFHCVALARIDSAFAKQQLLNMGHEWYQHASGQYPAYEWNFDDVNPPVVGWAAWRVYQIEKERAGVGDLTFLKEIFQNEMLNFSFWINRKDSSGRDIFGGGFLGMDNIGCFDRDKPLADGAQLEQSDGTSWMALYCTTMLSIATELAQHEPFYQNMALKYFEHFLSIAHAMTNMNGEGINLWDEEDQFFYDVVHLTDGQNIPLKIHSMVGLVPIFAVLTTPRYRSRGLDLFAERAEWFLRHRPDLLKNVAPVNILGDNNTRMLAILTKDRLAAVLRRMLDPNEFLSDYGIRALSRYHLDHPYVFSAGGQEVVVKYEPAESENRLFGGNSNWRGPIWFPVNYMLVQALQEFHKHYDDSFQVECPTGSGRTCNLDEVGAEITRRLTSIFKRNASTGWRAVYGGNAYFQNDPHWRDHIPFHEYFHGDNGAGLGASHQTGWTALIVSLLYEYGGRLPKTSKERA